MGTKKHQRLRSYCNVCKGHSSNVKGMVICVFNESSKHICNCGFGILVNFDAVSRHTGVFLFGCAVFGPSFRPPLLIETANSCQSREL